MPSPHNHPDITTSSTEHYLRENARLRRLFSDIKGTFPFEAFRPKNQHLHTPTLQRIWNLLLKYEQTK